MPDSDRDIKAAASHARVRNDGLGCGRNAVVNWERVVKQRIGEFSGDSLGSGRNHHGCVRTPKTLTRTGENGRTAGKRGNPWRSTRKRRTPRTLALGVVRELVGHESARYGNWLPVCNPFHNRSLSPAVNRSPSISTGYQRAGRSRLGGSGVELDFTITLPDADVASRVVGLSQIVSQTCRKDQPRSPGRPITHFIQHYQLPLGCS